MPNPKRILELILLGRSDSNIEFNDVRRLLDSLGFIERIKGSHHIFAKAGIAEIINIQPKGNKAKSYQVRQIRNIILNYKLGIDDE